MTTINTELMMLLIRTTIRDDEPITDLTYMQVGALAAAAGILANAPDLALEWGRILTENTAPSEPEASPIELSGYEWDVLRELSDLPNGKSVPVGSIKGQTLSNLTQLGLAVVSSATGAPVWRITQEGRLWLEDHQS